METINLTNLIKNLNMYRAHSRCLDENAENREYVYETLQEHTDRTSKYFKKFWQAKKCDIVFEKFCDNIWTEIDDNDKNYIKKILKEMIFAIPIFHDTGKINPVFQKEVMKNVKFTGINDFSSKNHAMISTVIYIDYFRYNVVGKIKDRKLRDLLKPFILYNAYVIFRHHSDLCDFNKFIGRLETVREKIIEAINKNEICTEKLKWRENTIKKIMENITTDRKNFSTKQNLYVYIYERLLYSLLVASDYYATGEFENGAEFKQDGDIDDISKWKEVYESTSLMKSIRAYQQNNFPQDEQKLQEVRDINVLRSEIFCEAEAVLNDEYKNNIFYLEAPTGSGKSNTAINLSFKLMELDRRLKKIFYVYPFNTLVEQNTETLENIFAQNQSIMQSIAVLNSLTPIKIDKQSENEDNVYQQALFDRQFLNYPMVLTTHVNLFETLFGNKQKAVFGFYQLANSVIVLDEIQSYKNTLWQRIISYLKAAAELLNMKIIIMSATLPDFDKFSHHQNAASVLLKNTRKYFNNSIFKNRVEVSYEILDKTDLKGEQLEDYLQEHVKQQIQDGRHIMIEFIKKSTAHRFWEKLKEDENINCAIELLSGDDSMAERKRILQRVKTSKEALILVSTQVIEAGVDIDMDLGYKDISKLDSEEQFMGRINRSCRKSGKVYFFNLDKARSIYKNDVRNNTELTLADEAMRKALAEKDFSEYYNRVLAILERNYRAEYNTFFDSIQNLEWEKIAEQMKLIDDDAWSMTVYLARQIKNEQGDVIDGAELWEKYRELLQDYSMSYAENKVKLSYVTAQMAEFMYQVKKVLLNHDEKIGSITYIEDGDKYFDGGKLNRARIQGEESDFIDFV
ncbi:CRISPR-associated helicase Cas3' [Megamonas hypermegale]|uniref:CRISPR-associated helicase Cas3' n=1 Tax=Megamonas hypermegale TaxID=158847 RepID=UPI0026ECF8DA|nr:CRISPR-associated helicase Cas3' [Megamonas hypermegale]